MRPDRFDAGFHKIPVCFVNMLYSGARCTNEVIFLDVRGVRSRHVCQQREKKEKVPIDRRCSLMQEVSVLRNRVLASFFTWDVRVRFLFLFFFPFILEKGVFFRRSILFHFLPRVSLQHRRARC